MARRLRLAFLSPSFFSTFRPPLLIQSRRSLSTFSSTPSPTPSMPLTPHHYLPFACCGNGVHYPPPYNGEIFCNRALNMSKICATGFDMDYTLAQYHSEQFETLSATNALKKLVHTLGYPPDLLKIEYDHSFFIRGLVVDKQHGNILKLDRHKYVKRVLHGFTPLTKEKRAQMYDHITTSGGGFAEPRFAVLDAMFALPDAFLFSSVVDYKDKHPGEIHQDYSQIYRDVRTSVDLCHRDGSIKNMVAQHPHKYIQRDDAMVPMLRQLKRSDKKVFLLTNSLWNYTNVVMTYLFGDNEGCWLDLFDVIITGSCKPAFMLNNRLPLYRVNPETGLLSNTDGVGDGTPEEYLAEGKCFQGGNYTHLHDLVGVSNGTHLLYVGDHMFTDVLRSKRTLGWRTMLIVPELENEINTLFGAETLSMGKEIEDMNALMDEKDEVVDRLASVLVSEDSIPLKRRRETEFELKEARADLERLKLKVSSAVDRFHKRFHETWGQLFKTGLQNSRFAEQVENYACLYTAKVTNIGKVSPEMHWRAMRDVMPHDRLPVTPMHRVLKQREKVANTSD